MLLNSSIHSHVDAMPLRGAKRSSSAGASPALSGEELKFAESTQSSIPASITPEDATLSSSSSSSQSLSHSRQLQTSGAFKSLSCSNYTDGCVPWDLLYGTSASNVDIGCNECVTMGNFINGETITLTGPLNIKGKLEFPSGTKVTLKTTAIIVQGELVMNSTKVVDGTPDVTIELYGSEDVLFTPDDEVNQAVCDAGSCNLGPKPFVVAGGTLDINGLPDTCPTWTTVKSITTTGKPVPTTYLKQPELPTRSDNGTCSEFILQETFANGLATWYGNLGAVEGIVKSNDTNGDYLQISSRRKDFQGPIYDVDKGLRECLVSLGRFTIRSSDVNLH